MTFGPGDIVTRRGAESGTVLYRVVRCDGEEVWMERLPECVPAHEAVAEMRQASYSECIAARKRWETKP